MNQYKTIGLLLVFTLFASSALVSAGTYYKTQQRGIISAVDTKKKTIVVRNELYKLRHAVRIHDTEQKLPSVFTLKPDMTIDFKTHKNRRTGLVEISEIWVVYF